MNATRPLSPSLVALEGEVRMREKWKIPPGYRGWVQMKQRCYNPNCDEFKNYGARGIRVCEEWKKSFAAFIAAVGSRPGPEYTIHRIDNDSGYEPGNVRWATPREQAAETRVALRLPYQGKIVCLAEASRLTGISDSTIGRRLQTGWRLEDALTLAPDIRRRMLPSKRIYPRQLTCPHCGVLFSPTHPGRAKYCSKRCAALRQYVLRSEHGVTK
jgi:hypothetical protein